MWSPLKNSRKKVFRCTLLSLVSTLLLSGYASRGLGEENHETLISSDGIPIELKHGIYSGWIYLKERNEKLTVRAEVFLNSQDDLKLFPQLVIHLKVNLGGSHSHEYMSEIFRNLKYDFDHGSLTFDEPGTNLFMVTKVTRLAGRTAIVGSVLARSTATHGSIELIEESDEPIDDEDKSGNLDEHGNSASSVGLLEGKYLGKCNGKTALMQIQTARGLNDGLKVDHSSGLERSYGISGRLATLDGQANASNSFWKALRHFDHGSYDIFTGKLTFQTEQSGDECRISGDNLNCKVRAFSETLHCILKRDSIVSVRSDVVRSYSLNPSAEQMSALPDPAPPLNFNLSRAVGGKFSGFIHNELNDSYIPLQLEVFPFSATDNPHNPNQLLISAAAKVFGGGKRDEALVVHNFETRSFYLRPGFTLSSIDSDVSIAVDDWRQGFIRGVLRSKGFGRVGEIQLVKAGDFPALPKDARFVGSVVGEFEMLSNGIRRWIKFLVPKNSLGSRDNVINLQGSYQSIVGNTPLREIKRGTFDLYTNRVAWTLTKDEVSTIGNGVLDLSGDLHLYWPSLPVIGVVVKPLMFEKFSRQP